MSDLQKIYKVQLEFYAAGDKAPEILLSGKSLLPDMHPMMGDGYIIVHSIEIISNGNKLAKSKIEYLTQEGA